MVSHAPCAPEASTPEEAASGFVAALAAGDPETAALCFSHRGCFITPDGTAIHGRERIAAVLAQMVEMWSGVVVELRSVTVAGDVAFCSERWTMRFAAVDAPALTRTSRSALVIGRVGAGWKLMVAAPWWS
jgi:ketosteroid isomerase-like protein